MKPNTSIVRIACATKLLLLLLLLTLPAVVQAQFNFTTNNNTITITGYTGTNGNVTIPDTITVGGVGLPVTSIAQAAFEDRPILTSVNIGNNVTNIGNYAFALSTSLASQLAPTSPASGKGRSITAPA
jgi:hypothetical protein